MDAAEQNFRINDYFRNVEKKVADNICNFLKSYDYESLCYILPQGTCVMILGEVPENEYIFEVIKKNRKSICILALTSALKDLQKQGILPDMIMVDSYLNEDWVINWEKFTDIPVVAAMNSSTEILEKHAGKIFYYHTNFFLESLISNHFVRGEKEINQTLTDFNGCWGRFIAFDTSVYMGAKKIIYFGQEPMAKDAVKLELDVDFKDMSEMTDGWESIATEFISPIEVDLDDILKNIPYVLNDIKSSDLKVELKNLLDKLLDAKNQCQRLWKQYYNLYEREKAHTVDKQTLQGIVAAVRELNTNLQSSEIGIETICFSRRMDNFFQIEKSDKAVEKNQLIASAETGMSMSLKWKFILENTEAVVRGMDYAKRVDLPLTSKSKVPKILLIYGASQYGVLPYFIHEILSEMQRRQYHVYILNFLGDANELQKFIFMQRNIGLDSVFSMNGVVLAPEKTLDSIERKFSYWRWANTKVIAYFVDHPIYNILRTRNLKGVDAVLYADRDWAKYANKFCLEDKNATFFPLGGIEQNSASINFEEKRKEIVFFGTCRTVDEILNEIDDLEENRDTFWKCVSFLQENTNATLEEAMDKISEEENYRIIPGSNLYHYLIGQVDTYIRQYFRRKVISALAYAGIPLKIYGWKTNEFDGLENVEIKNAVSMSEMLEICRNTQYVLNIQPWLKEGTQERVFNGMLGESVVVTDSTNYLEAICEDERNILFYNLDEINELPKKIKYYMEHLEEAKKIAQAGYILAKSGHTWAKRTEELMELIK